MSLIDYFAQMGGLMKDKNKDHKKKTSQISERVEQEEQKEEESKEPNLEVKNSRIEDDAPMQITQIDDDDDNANFNMDKHMQTNRKKKDPSLIMESTPHQGRFDILNSSGVITAIANTSSRKKQDSGVRIHKSISPSRMEQSEKSEIRTRQGTREKDVPEVYQD